MFTIFRNVTYSRITAARQLQEQLAIAQQHPTAARQEFVYQFKAAISKSDQIFLSKIKSRFLDDCELLKLRIVSIAQRRRCLSSVHIQPDCYTNFTLKVYAHRQEEALLQNRECRSEQRVLRSKSR